MLRSSGVLVVAEADLPEPVTRYYYLTFLKSGSGLEPGTLREASSAEAAINAAKRWESEVAGVVAYAATSEADMDSDALVEPVVLYRAGRVPPELAEA